MLLKELSSEFQILFEDLATAGSKGLDSFEKSVCFTHAQEAVIKQLAVENDLESIKSLVAVHKETNAVAGTYVTSKFYTGVANPLHILGYFASRAGMDIPALPVSQQLIDRMLLAPYKYPPKDLVYVVVGANAKNLVFLPLNFTATSFSVRYVEYPTPIILTALTGGDSINGLTAQTIPVLEASLHRKLVNAAVQYAITVYIGQPEKEVADGSAGD